MFGRNGKAGKQILLFTIMTSVVVLVGLAAMTAYAVFLQRDEKEQKPEVQYEALGLGAAQPPLPRPDVPDAPDVPETVGEPSVEELLAAANEALYSAALEQGQNVRLAECAGTESVTFAFAGDLLLDDGYAIMSNYRLRGSNIDDTFSAGLLERMRGADVFMLNNEFTFTTRGQPTPEKQFTFRAKPENVEFLHQIGVDVVSLANNHAYDYGEVSLLDTMETLRNADIAYVGAGNNLEEAMKPTYIIANGMKIAIVSATQIERNGTPDTKGATQSSPGVLRCMNPDNLLTVIKEAEANSDFTILYIHWGTEGQEGTDRLQEEQAPLYAEAGADLIIGDHPHCLQRLDVVAGVPVIYSMGNYWFNSRTMNTCLVEISIKEGALERFQFIPCRQSDCRTKLLEGAEKEEALQYMRSISPNVEIDSEGNVLF
ncbi:MAG: CapA family protein [Roseburia sp.]|nr:CapA family protein [Roseburia sp.]